MYTFTIPVNPQPKQRPRFGKGRTYTPKETLVYERHVAAAATAAKLPTFEERWLEVDIDVYCEPRRGGLADVDNYAKAILDGLKSFFNDRYVDVLTISRFEVAPGEGRADVRITERFFWQEPNH